MVTIGITGTIGAGKGTIVDHLKTKNFAHYSAREFLLKEVAKRGLEPIRENITTVANDLRKEHFPGYIISELLEEAKRFKGDRVIESIRTLGEIDILRKNDQDFYLLAVDAQLPIRYERIKKRASSTDNVSYEKFVEDEAREFDSKEPWKQNLKACIAAADFVLANDDTFEKLDEHISRILAQIKAKNVER